MDSIYFDQLYDKAREAQLTQVEVDSVIAELSNNYGNYDQASLIRIIGYAGDPSLAAEIDPFLLDQDCDVAGAALWVLCMDWDLCDRYKSDIIRFVDGVPGDEHNDCRRKGIYASGIYLAKHSDPYLLRRLIDFVLDANLPVDVRESAYIALLDALGYGPQKYPVIGDFNPNAPETAYHIDQALSRLSAEEANHSN
jgi:hypothetical protein